MMREEIAAIIKVNLPQQVGEQLQILLKEGEKNKVDLEEANRKLEVLDRQFREVKATVEIQAESIKSSNTQLINIEQREKAVLDLEHRETINLLKVSHANDMSNFAERTLQLVFKSPVYKESITKLGSIPFDAGPQYQGGPHNIYERAISSSEVIEKKVD